VEGIEERRYAVVTTAYQVSNIQKYTVAEELTSSENSRKE
jgi:hypothetical protein